MYKNKAAILVCSMLLLVAPLQCHAEESSSKQDSLQKEAVLSKSDKKRGRKKNNLRSAPSLNGVLVLPAGKTFGVALKAFIGGDEASPGVEFLARTLEDTTIDDMVAIEAGSIIHGKIVESISPKNLYTSNSISMKCDYITLKSGRIVPMVATLTDRKTVMGKFVAGVGQLIPSIQTMEVYPGAQLVLKLLEDLRLPIRSKQ